MADLRSSFVQSSGSTPGFLVVSVHTGGIVAGSGGPSVFGGSGPSTHIGGLFFSPSTWQHASLVFELADSQQLENNDKYTNVF